MTGDVEFQVNQAGVRQLLKSPGVEAIVGQYAAQVASAANGIGTGHYGSRTRVQSVSVHGYAYTENFAAMVENAEGDVLNMALGGAG